MGRVRAVRRLVVAMLAVAGCASACATSTAGHGTGGKVGPTRFPSSFPAPTGATGSGGPTLPPPSSLSVPTPGSSSTAIAPSTGGTNSPVTTVHGADGTAYQVELLAADRVSDCSAHSYGAPIIEYFHAHPCERASRRLFGILVQGRVAVMSAIAVSCAVGPGQDTYKWTSELYRLERANGTGSMNDLLREGVRVSGVPDAIPAHEAFGVFEQDTVVAIMDAWWASGTTPDQDRTLLKTEQNLFPTPLTSP